MNCLIKVFSVIKQLYSRALSCLSTNVYFGKYMAGVPDGSMVFFPCHNNILCCGLTGIVSFKKKKKTEGRIDIASLNGMLKKIEDNCYANCRQNDLNFKNHYLGGKKQIDAFFQKVRSIKCNGPFYNLFIHQDIQDELAKFSNRLSEVVDTEEKFLADHMGHLESDDADILSQHIDYIKDIFWCLTSEIAHNIKNVKDLLRNDDETPTIDQVNIFKQINSVLNSIDRLEVRGP